MFCTDAHGTFSHLEIAPKGEPDFVEGHKAVSEVLAKLLGFPHGIKCKTALTLRVGL